MDPIISTLFILAFCKQNCAETGERGCDSCKIGYVSEPECCDCDTIGNETHAFYRTTDGKCLCKSYLFLTNGTTVEAAA